MPPYFLYRGYDHRVPNPAMPGEFHAEVSYKCKSGYDFEFVERNTASGEKRRLIEKYNKLYCSEGRWEGRVPECLEEKYLTDRGHGGGIYGVTGSSPCTLEQETELSCEHSCLAEKQDDDVNTAGSTARCVCHQGYELNHEDRRTCLGTF